MFYRFIYWPLKKNEIENKNQLEALPTQQRCCVYVLVDNISNCCASVLLNYLQASYCRVRRRRGRLASPTGAPSVSCMAPPPDWTSCVAFQTEFGSRSGSAPANCFLWSATGRECLIWMMSLATR